MKYLCLGYYDEKQWEAMSESQREALIEECFAYDRILKKGGHFVDGVALQSHTTATTLRWENGKVAVTDGPYAETKEQIGGILIMEAANLDQAIQLMSKHPGVRFSKFEVRPIDEEFTAMAKARTE